MGNCFCVKNNEISELQNIVNISSISEPTYDFKYARVISVYDGDTFTIIAKHKGEFTKFKVRLYGVDAPDLKGEEKQKAKQFVIDTILNKVVRIEVLNNRIVNGKKITEKYGRILARVFTLEKEDLSQLLLKEGLAKEYYGGTK